ncbi:hypothetical protein CLU79DRAFT_837758 [Phycomyces nitens]|nr:hypothetical protein CLU79DRAFT_837758 [Phycomyces nitens]
MLVDSGIIGELRESLDKRGDGGELYAIYGDPAYSSSDILIKPFRNSQTMPRVEKDINNTMSTLRIIVEWEFGHVANLFAFVRYRPGKKGIAEQPTITSRVYF